MIKIPAYIRVYNSIRKQIEDGEYPIGSLLPPEPELEKIFSVSRTTIRKAVEILSRDGFLLTKQGRGTEVLDPKTTQKLNYVTSFTETLREKGYEVSSKSTYIDSIIPPHNVSFDLNINPESKVVRIQRIQLANEKPIAIMVNYLVSELFPGIEKYAGKFISLYEFLETNYNITIESATDYIKAKAADFAEAEMLEIPIGSPLLVLRRISFSNNKPFEVVILTIISDKYEFCVHMTGRAPSNK
jgi:GntR family transcriptional regulator